ncbi:MAG: hypothetical protein M1438_01265 [Deltaproteobacteria bacterium]|nr:hypothetical protein [Deltaproteobacteria bacterium]
MRTQLIILAALLLLTVAPGLSQTDHSAPVPALSPLYQGNVNLPGIDCDATGRPFIRQLPASQAGPISSGALNVRPSLVVAARGQNPPNPSPAPPISHTVKVYGAPWRWFSLDNMNIGTHPKCHGTAMSYRFRADHTGQAEAVQFFLQVQGAGYAMGDAGILRVELQTDDGTAGHFPSGKVLAFLQLDNLYGRVRHNGYSWIHDRLRFNAPASLTAGQLYHLVVSNASPDPYNNWFDINNMCVAQLLSPIQTGVSDTDYCLVRKVSGVWKWDERVKHDTPIFTLYFKDGHSLGAAYLQVYPTTPCQIQGNTRMRETFTVTGGDQIVSKMSVACWVANGANPGRLTIRLEQGDGTLIEEGAIPAALAPMGEETAINWVTYAFSSPRTLKNGSTYHLVVSAPAGDPYNFLPMMKGSAYGFRGWEFQDGWVEQNSGSGWVPGVPERHKLGKHFDMMFYFTPKP